MSDENRVSTVAKIGCGILIGVLLLPVSCVGVSAALVAQGAAVEHQLRKERTEALSLGEPRLEVDANDFSGRASWGAQVTNAGDSVEVVTLFASFLDKDGLPIAEDVGSPERIEPGTTKDITGVRHVTVEDALRIEKIRVVVK